MQTEKSKKAKRYCKEFECPVCHHAMKVNHDFQTARCLNCGLEICWRDPVSLTYSILRIAEEIGVRHHGWRRQDLPTEKIRRGEI